MQQNPEYSYPSKTYTLHGTHQSKISISTSFPQHSFDPKTRPNIRDSCKPSRDAAIASSSSARHPGAVPRVSCTGLIQLSVSLYSEIELCISLLMGRLWESHFQTKFALLGYARPPRGALRWGSDNVPTASNCKPKVKSAFLQIFRNICFLATLLLVNQFAKIFMNSKLQGHGYSKMLTCDNTTKYSPQMFPQYLPCSR